MKELAIQISEKHLSKEARNALANAKNKSQFLRNALEFYVKSITVADKDSDNSNFLHNSEVIKDIKEIKDILLRLSSHGEIAGTINLDDIEENPKDLINEQINKQKSLEKKNDGLSDDERREIEKMLDNSLDVFDF